MPQNAFFLRTRDLLVSQKMTQRHFISTLYPFSTVIFATATVLAFVLLRDSRFNFHCYTQREATLTQRSARKCAATSRDFFRERLQSAFTLANQLRWVAQNANVEVTSSHVTRPPLWKSNTMLHTFALNFVEFHVVFDQKREEKYTCGKTFIYIYIYIYIEREREREARYREKLKCGSE